MLTKFIGGGVYFLMIAAETLSCADLSLTAQAQLIAGMKATSFEEDTAVIESSPEWLSGKQGQTAEYFWNLEQCNGRANQLNFFMPKRKEIDRFLQEQLSEVYDNARHIIYFFGGADFSYPDLFFPNMETLILVGAEPCGSFPDVYRYLEEGTLTERMSDIGALYGLMPFGSYYITETLETSKWSNITTLLAISIALSNYQIVSFASISINGQGEIASSNNDEGRQGIHLVYKKHNEDRDRHVFYLSYRITPDDFCGDLEQFIKKQAIDTAFYKATSFVTHALEIPNKIVLEQVKYIVQDDTGIPFRMFDHNFFDVHLFGIYARPYFSTQPIPLYWGVQSDLLSAYSSSIYRSHSQKAKDLMEEIWGSTYRSYSKAKVWGSVVQSCSVASSNEDSVSWRGFVPFHFGYGGQFTAPSVQAFTSALQYVIAR